MSKKLQATLASLASSFALEVIEALGHAPFAELQDIATASHHLAAATLSASRTSRTTPAAEAPAAKSPAAKFRALKTRAGKKPSVKVTSRSTEASTPRPNPKLTEAAVAFFSERGRKGATLQQVTAHLTAIGLTPNANVVDALAQHGAIRDAGFRRAAGNGNATAPVYVLTA